MSIGATTCRWVLASGAYCEKPTKYKMVEDGGEPGAALIRQYNSFCPEHLARKDVLMDEDGTDNE